MQCSNSVLNRLSRWRGGAALAGCSAYGQVAGPLRRLVLSGTSLAFGRGLAALSLTRAGGCRRQF